MSLSDDVVQDLCVARVRGPTARISRRRDARDDFTGKVRQKSRNDGRRDTTDGKSTLPTDATQAPDPSERSAVGGRLHALVGRA